MAHAFDQPVTRYMASELEIGALDTPIDALARAMQGRRISAIPIVDESNALVGVVSRTDLIHLGVQNRATRTTSSAMALPRRRARDVMTPTPQTVPVSATVRAAATAMVERGIHRVFATRGPRLAGVVSCVDIAAVVRDAEVDLELSAIMTSPIVSIEASAPLGHAVEVLERLHVTGLVVTDGVRPIGVFTQLDALACRDLPRNTPIDTVHDAAVVCLPATTKLYRAADHVVQPDVQRVIVCKDREAIGIVTGLDFARYVARN